jgi:hypothetical protein
LYQGAEDAAQFKAQLKAVCCSQDKVRQAAHSWGQQRRCVCQVKSGQTCCLQDEAKEAALALGKLEAVATTNSRECCAFFKANSHNFYNLFYCCLQDEAKEAALSLGKLEAVATKLKDSQEAAARELVIAQTKAREDAAALEKAKEKANHYR